MVPGVQAGREEDMDDILAMLVSRQDPCWSMESRLLKSMADFSEHEIHEIFIDWDELLELLK